MASFSDKNLFAPEALQREVHQAVVEMIQRRRGGGAARAVHAVAKLIGIKERRVVQYLRDEVRHPPAWEFLTIRKRWQADQARWAADLNKQAEQIREKIVVARGTNDQKSMEVGVPVGRGNRATPLG